MKIWNKVSCTFDWGLWSANELHRLTSVPRHLQRASWPLTAILTPFLTSFPSFLRPRSEDWSPKRWCMFSWPRYNADVVAMTVVTVVTVALTSLAAAWHPGLVAHSLAHDPSQLTTPPTWGLVPEPLLSEWNEWEGTSVTWPLSPDLSSPCSLLRSVWLSSVALGVCLFVCMLKPSWQYAVSFIS